MMVSVVDSRTVHLPTPAILSTMATRYLSALDYSDYHSRAVLRKHAKRRPLGYLESRYHYTPAQPVLSCRTVDIDLSGTRTYRPRSTTDILKEQHSLVTKIFRDTRPATSSAPPRRSSKTPPLGVSSDGAVKTRDKIQIQGRPCTSLSQISSDTLKPKSSSTSNRPKTTGGRFKKVKPVTDCFMKVAVDRDLLETRKSQTALTNQIHAHWRPENCDLNQGHFMRGQKRPDDVPPTLDAWLSFGAGGGEETTEGVVDAFANFRNAEDYYNIEGSIGSRVAEQLQKGDKIRIGINGEVHSHDLKVKKWIKDNQSPSQEGEQEVEKAEATPRSVKDKPQPAGQESDNPLDDSVFDTLDATLEDSFEEKKEEKQGEPTKSAKALPEFPLNWEDQVSRPEVKVIHPRVTPRDRNMENLCETHHVIYNATPQSTQQRPKLATPTHPTNGYRVKQRPPPSGKLRADNRLDSKSGKVKAMTLNQNSAEEEERLSAMSVDDVIQGRLERASTSPAIPVSTTPGADADTDQEALRLSEKQPTVTIKKNSTQRPSSAASKSSASSGRSSGGHRSTGSGSVGRSGRGPLIITPRPTTSVPTRGSRDVQLSLTTQTSARKSRQGSGAGVRSAGLTKAPHHGLGGSANSINSGPVPGDTHFIQISRAIRSPSSSVPALSSGHRALFTSYSVSSPASTPRLSPLRSNTPDLEASGQDTPRADTPKTITSEAERPEASIDTDKKTVQEPEEDQEIAGTTASEEQSSPGPVAFSIPTADGAEEDEDEEMISAAARRERSLRDDQINQITDLLHGAIVSRPN